MSEHNDKSILSLKLGDKTQRLYSSLLRMNALTLSGSRRAYLSHRPIRHLELRDST